MWPLATVVMWSLCLSVGPTKTAELINMPIGLWTRVGPRNYIYSVMAHISPGEGAIWFFFGPLKSIVIVRSVSSSVYNIQYTLHTDKMCLPLAIYRCSSLADT